MDRINTLALDIGVIRTSEVKKGMEKFEIPSRFTYSLFVRSDQAPQDKNAVWVIQNVPMALVERYQSEFISAAEEKQIRPKISLLCSTFPQARRAVTSGYAAVLPTAAFTAEELADIRKFELPFGMPKFVQDETTISIVWNRRLEEIRDNFQDVLKVFRDCLTGPGEAAAQVKVTSKSTAKTIAVGDITEPQAPPGTNRIIIFDTNAYRYLTCDSCLADSRSKAIQLRQCEQKAGNFTLASPIVIWELIGHLSDTNDPAYRYCLNALVALAEHTWSPFDPNAGVCLFADAASTVCRELFRVVPPIAAQNVGNLSKLVAYVRNHAPNLTLPAALNNFKAFSAELAKLEANWLADMQKILTDCDPQIAKPWIGGKDDKDVRRKLISYFASPAFMDAWAAITVMRHANMLDIKLTPAGLNEKARVMREVFPAPFHLMSALLQKFPTPKPMNLTSRKKNRGNFMCDTAICFSIGGFHQVGSAPMFLVTADKAIKEAAIAAGCPDRVISLPEYLKSVRFL